MMTMIPVSIRRASSVRITNRTTRGVRARITAQENRPKLGCRCASAPTAARKRPTDHPVIRRTDRHFKAARIGSRSEQDPHRGSCAAQRNETSVFRAVDHGEVQRIVGGTSIFNGMGYTDASVSGGSSVSLSTYTGGGSGGGGGGGGRW